MQDIQSSLFADRRLNKTTYHLGFAEGHGNSSSLKCPRCGCLNTKFCYYNNYNLSQPRFFCKGCRRYWTKGGVLRNVPVGGGSRKTKRSKQKKAGSTNGKPSSVSEQKSNDSQRDNISPEITTPTEAAPRLFNQSSEPPMMLTDNVQELFSDELTSFRSLMTSSSDLGFISAPEISSLTLQRDKDDQVVVENNNNNNKCSSNGGDVVAEDWGLIDHESYWLSNTADHQLNYLL